MKQVLKNLDLKNILKFKNKYKGTLNCLSLLKHDMSCKYDLIEKQLDVLDKEGLIDWKVFSNRKISEDLLRKIKNNITWENVLAHNQLSESFLKEMNIDFNLIVRYQKVSEKFLKEGIKKVPFMNFKIYELLFRHKLSLNFLEEFFPFFESTFDNVIRYQKLTEEFLEKHKDSIKQWNNIICYQTHISYDFIEKYQNKFDWKNLWLISFPYSFHKKFIHNFNIEYLEKELKDFPDRIPKKLKELINQQILMHQL